MFRAPEGAPSVFRPPGSALEGQPPDRRGYNFDGCAPDALIERASVKDVVDHIEHVIKDDRELMDVLPVKRRDEGFVELVHDLIGHLIAAVFDPFHPLHFDIIYFKIRHKKCSTCLQQIIQNH